MATKRIAIELMGESAIDADIMYASMGLSSMSRKEADSEFMRIALIALDAQRQRTAMQLSVRHPTIADIEQFCLQDIESTQVKKSVLRDENPDTETGMTDIGRELISIPVEDLMYLLETNEEIRPALLRAVHRIKAERPTHTANIDETAPLPAANVVAETPVTDAAPDAVASAPATKKQPN